ncbi:hypothetical protein INR49_020787 [Caranx melampygus]|nr:hypothetical protein INR49_020787 [Caranx melampygus]
MTNGYVIQGQRGWRVTYTDTHICASKGSTVETSCTYSYPEMINRYYTTVQGRYWFVKGGNYDAVDVTTDSDYTGRVENHCDERKRCTLRIRDLRERDSAVYKFTFITNKVLKFTGEPGVTLFVTGEPVMIMNTMRLTLMLLMLVTLVVFSLWTRKKKTLSSNPEPKEAVEMMEVDSGPVYEDVTTAAQTEDREEQEDLIKGRAVDVTRHSDYTGRVENHCDERKRCTLRIRDLRERDSAVYKFVITTDKDPDLQVLVERSSDQVELKCSLTSAAAGTITVVLLVLVLLAVFLWIRRDKLFTQQCERGERPDTGAELNTGPGFDSPSSAAGQQDELHYASISFSQNQGDVVYSNIRVHQEEEEVQYSTVGPKNSSSASGIKRTHILFVVHHIDRQTAATDVRGQHVLNYLVDVKLST